jgi:hypothetical protein
LLSAVRFFARPGIAAVPLSHQAASRSYRLHHLEHRDPAAAFGTNSRLSV